MIRIQKINQSGAAMIMFAMIMMVVLSLIAVGFAFLVRNDQRQTLDKTLSNQALYAAESAINRKAKELKSGTEPIKLKDDCSATPTDFFGAAFSEVQITCLNWDTQPEVLSINNIDESPKTVKVKPLSGNVQYFAVRWKPKNACNTATVWQQFLNTLSGATACPYLKVSLSNAADVYAGTGRGTIIYARAQSDASALPTNNAGNTFSYAQENGGNAPTYTSAAYANQSFSNPSGEIDNTYCAGGYCLTRIRVPNGAVWNNANTGLVAFSSIGGQVDIEISAYTSALNLATETTDFFPGLNVAPVLKTTNRAKLVDAQAIIDATAKTNDVVKRVRVSVPIGSDTWVPGFAINANTICKNYQVNANGNTTAGPANGTVCY